MTITRTRRTSRRVACQGFERLEGRRLFSTGGLDNPVVALDWNGQTTQAEAGEFILSLSGKTRLTGGRDEAGQVSALQRALRDAAGVTVEEHLGRAGQFLLDVPQDRPYEDVLASVKRLPGFEYLEPNFVFSLEATPNDPLFGYEYGLHNTGYTPLGASKADADIDAVEAWDVTTGGAGDVVIGVVDSGIDYTHPDLAPNMWRNPFETAGDGVDNDGNGYVDDVHGINAIANNGDPMDDNSHGTHAAGTIAAAGNNGVGITGVAWNAKLMGLKFLAADGSGSTADAIECLNYATSMRQKGVNIRLTSNSWGGGGFEQALSDAISRTNAAGMLFVAAAGNGGEDGVGDNNDVYGSYPANYNIPNVLSVAATDRYDNLAGFSNFGAATVDLAAPGVDVASTVPGNGYAYMSGTSMATPHVAGVAALAFAHKPSATVAEVRSALLSGVDALSNLSGKVATGGRLNALNTLRALGNSLSGVAYDDADGDGSRGGAEAALAGRTVWLDLNSDGAVDSATATLASANVPLSVPDRGGVGSTLAVSGTSGVVTDVNVRLDIAHTYAADVRAYLVSPSGRRVELVSIAGGDGDNFTDTVFDDEAATPVAVGAAPFTGSFRPVGSLADFDGQSANGTWTLQVDDVAQYDAGTLLNWSITLATGEPTRATDSAGAYKFGPLAPGAYVVRQVVPVGWSATGPVAGYHAVQVVDGQNYAGRDFASRAAPANAAPTAAAQLTDVTAGWGYHWFKVTYADDVAVDGASINGTDVSVTGPNGYAQTGVLSSLQKDGGTATATYRVAAPGGAWDAADNGTYTVSMRANEVRDKAGAYVAAGTLGTFASRLGDTVAPTASLAAADVTASGGGYYWFNVTYADNVAIAYGVIDGNDVLVTGPNGYSQKGVLSSASSSGSTRTATYRVPAPGGAFGAEDNGAYTVTLQPFQVADTSRNFVAAGVLGGFTVAVPQASLIAATGAGGGQVFSERPVTADLLTPESEAASTAQSVA